MHIPATIASLAKPAAAKERLRFGRQRISPPTKEELYFSPMSTTSDKIEDSKTQSPDKPRTLTVRVMSFGYKLGNPPAANALFDVRFLKNPYWVEHLRPLTGRDEPVQEYVMNQKAAHDFLESLVELLSRLLPQLQEHNMSEFSIAFGCTGGQHRSATMVELLARSLASRFPDVHIERIHRELDGKTATAQSSGAEDEQ